MNLRRIIQTVRKRLAPLVKRCPDQPEHQLFILHLHRHGLMTRQPYHRAADIRPRHKAVRRHVCDNLRLCIILHRQRERTVILRPRSDLHPVCDFLLHHDRNAVNRHMALKQPHDNRRSNIIRKICHHLDRFPGILLLRELYNIQLQNVLIDNRHIVISAKRVRQNRDQVLIDLHRRHLSGIFTQILGHRADARSDLQHKVILRNARRLNNALEHMGINEKILSELFLKIKMILLQNRYGVLRDS